MDILLEDLKKQIKKGNALIIVGAGVSIGATDGNQLAGWTGLLHNGVTRCVEIDPSTQKGWDERANEGIDKGDILEIISVAEVISAKLGAPKGGEYSRWLRESVGTLKYKNREVIDALHSLGIPIATTNYDGLLEEVTGLSPVTWMDGHIIERTLRGEDEKIIHLHGFWEKPESVILGIRSYEKILNNELFQSFLKTIQIMRTVIFVGCGEGLSDPNFEALLEWTGKVLSGSEYRRFRLAREEEVETLQKQHTSEQRLCVISYGKDYDDLAPFIKSLVPNKHVDQEAASPAINGVCRTPQIPSAPHCFGRDEQLKELVDTLLTDKPEPTPILGPPGIGKSTLVSTVLRDQRVVDRYGACRFFIRCDGIMTRNSLAAEIARALWIEMSPKAEPMCLYELGKHPSILVLDNLETPWEADTKEIEAFLGALAEVQGLALIITMRGSVRPSGVKWREPIRVDPLKLIDSRKIFIAIAGGSFREDILIDTLCNAMEGVPLAINLIAHAAEGEPNLKGIWKRWEDERTSMLKCGAGADRLTNIEISYKLSINGPRMVRYAKRLLSLLAFLPDGLAHSDFEAVLPNKSDEAASVLRKVGLAFDESDRLRLLAPLREYVMKYHSPDKKSKDRLMIHYLNLIRRHSSNIGSESGEEARSRLSPEASNIEYLAPIILKNYPSEDTIRVICLWGNFVNYTGVGTTRPFEAALTAAELLKKTDLIAICIYWIGIIENGRSNLDTALSHFEKALPLFKVSEDIVGEAECTFFIGSIAFYHSEHEKAQQKYEQALTLYRIENNLIGEANCMKEIGDIAFYRSEYKAAYTQLAQAVDLFNSIENGGIQGEANCINRMGVIAFEQSDFELARSCFERALLSCKKTGSVNDVETCRVFLGAISLEKSEYKMANSRFMEALSIIGKFGETRGKAFCKRHLANLNVKLEKYETAFQHYEEALQFYNKVSDVYGKAHCAMGFGDIASAKSNNEEAQKHYEEALALFKKIPNPYNIGQVYRRMARIATNEENRKCHVKKAHEVWEKVDLPILISELETEFPNGF
ncbi:MAG: tetratricopeptide repeat protein [bacterium]